MEVVEKNEYEKCVLCWKQLDILKSTPIGQRKHYISGGGQLCEDCYKEVQSEGNSLYE